MKCSRWFMHFIWTQQFSERHAWYIWKLLDFDRRSFVLKDNNAHQRITSWSFKKACETINVDGDIRKMSRMRDATFDCIILGFKFLMLRNNRGYKQYAHPRRTSCQVWGCIWGDTCILGRFLCPHTCAGSLHCHGYKSLRLHATIRH